MKNLALMGASGSGKSTLLNILGILDTYDEGNYHLNGQLIHEGMNENEAARGTGGRWASCFSRSTLSPLRTHWRMWLCPSITKGYHAVNATS